MAESRVGTLASRGAVPAGPARAAARRAPLGALRTYRGVDHFDIYDGPRHEAVVADEIAFLRHHLLAASARNEPIGALERLG